MAAKVEKLQWVIKQISSPQMKQLSKAINTF